VDRELRVERTGPYAVIEKRLCEPGLTDPRKTHQSGGLFGLTQSLSDAVNSLDSRYALIAIAHSRANARGTIGKVTSRVVFGRSAPPHLISALISAGGMSGFLI